MQNILVYGQSSKFQQLLTFIVAWVHLSICDQYGIHKLLYFLNFEVPLAHKTLEFIWLC
jgi:hypothetical protein